MTENSLWADISPAASFTSNRLCDTTTDVCVIGGGITGLSSAIHLAEKGIDVVLLESQRVGGGASGRSAGLVNAGTWLPPDRLVNEMGKEHGEKLNSALSSAPDLVFNLIKKYAIDAQESRSGNITIAHNKSGERDIELRYKQLQRRNADVEIITGERSRQITGSPVVNKILLDKRGGTLNPLSYTRGLAEVASKLGVKIHECSPVKMVVKLGKKWCVYANDSIITTNQLVIATNVYTSGEWTKVQEACYPVYYYQLATVPLPNEIGSEILPFNTGAHDTRTALSSLRKDTQGRLLLGTVGAGKPNKLYKMWANKMLKYYFPMLNTVAWQYHWSGKFGFTNNSIFRVLEPSEGIISAVGYNGRGITTGTLMGKCFAEYILTGNKAVIPLPFTSLNNSKIRHRKIKAQAIESSLRLYHAGQVLNIFR